MDDELISACIRDKINEGWEQDRAVAACISMAESGQLGKGNLKMETKALKFDDSVINMEERTFKGYASTFGNIDEVGDIIEKGSFTKSISERGPRGSNQIKILWQHADPLGIPTHMEEDSKGLYVEGKISKTALGNEALELMRDGVVDKMSIGFSIPKGKSMWDEKDNVRRIKEVKLYEFSPVTFPANELATITAVKSAQWKLNNNLPLNDQDLAELHGLYLQLKALLETEPPSTHELEPQIDPEIFQSIKELRDFASTRLY
jgi:HK97 family phage prohead protease